jgi:hypothetical protein
MYSVCFNLASFKFSGRIHLPTYINYFVTELRTRNYGSVVHTGLSPPPPPNYYYEQYWRVIANGIIPKFIAQSGKLMGLMAVCLLLIDGIKCLMIVMFYVMSCCCLLYICHFSTLYHWVWHDRCNTVKLFFGVWITTASTCSIGNNIKSIVFSINI